VERKLQLNTEQLKIVTAYKELFNSDHGKIVLKDLETSFDGDIFVKNDPYATHVRIGRRDVVLRIREMINRNFEPLRKEDEDG